MLYHFHNRRVVKAIRYSVKAIRYRIYAEAMHDQWKQIPYPILFLRRSDGKSSNRNKV